MPYACLLLQRHLEVLSDEVHNLLAGPVVVAISKLTHSMEIQVLACCLIKAIVHDHKHITITKGQVSAVELRNLGQTNARLRILRKRGERQQESSNLVNRNHGM
jgi:hypothetical protein